MIFGSMRSLRRAILCFAAAFASAFATNAATINVPSTATPTIQSAIDAASPGDKVIVAPGTYFENIDFKGKAIIVQSAGFSEGTFNGPGGVQTGGQPDTIIDGGGNGPAVTFASGEGPDSRLNGFTIQHGGGSKGVAINSGANQVTSGILVLNAAPFLTSNTITQNNCYGVMIENGSPQMQYNIISHTTGTFSPQCSYVATGTGVLVDGEYDQQTTPAHGPTTLGNNIIENNTNNNETLTAGGGGIHIIHGYTYLAYNLIRNNFSHQPGGGIAVSSNAPVSDTVYIRNNILYGNSSACGGGGLAFNALTAETIGAPVYFVYNNTIVDNIDTNVDTDICPVAHASGSQVYLWQDLNRFVFVNNIIAGTSATNPAIYCETNLPLYPQYHLAIFDHNDLYNAQGAAVSGQCLDPTGDPYGNISADPLFKDRANNDYHLTTGSPAIDTGNNSAIVFPDFDIDTLPRQQDATSAGYPIVDMGAYEFTGTVDYDPTQITITPSAYVINAGDIYTIDADFLSQKGVPYGSVTLYQDGKFFVGTFVSIGTLQNFGATESEPGAHSLVLEYPGVNFPGPSGIPAANSIKFNVVVNGGNPSTMSLASSLNPSNPGQTVTFTATVTAASGTPTGTVVFSDGGATLCTQTLAGGVATCATSTLAAGIHHILAAYTPDSNSYLSSTATLAQLVNGTVYATNVQFSSDPNPSPVGYRATFTINSASADASYIPSPIVLTDTTTNTVLRSLVPDSSGNAIYSTTSLSAGIHHITATYAGDATHAAEQLYIDQDVVGTAAFPTATSLTSSLNPANSGQSVTFTATVTSPNGVPIGFVGFSDGVTTLATPTLVNGVASFTTSALAPGTHPIFVSYNASPADEPFLESNATLSQVINGIATTTKLTVIPTTAAYGTTISMYSQVLASETTVTSGTITYMDGATALTTIALAPNRIPNFTISTLTVGTHIITAVYSGDAAHSGSTSAPVTVTITAAATALSLTATPNPALALQPITLTANLTGTSSAAAGSTIVFSASGTSFNVVYGPVITNAQGIATLAVSLPAGRYTLGASFAGNANVSPATAPLVVEVVNPNPTTAAVYAQPNPGYQNTNETLTASILTEFSTGPIPPIPTGTVTFLDAGAPIATAPLDAKGQATFSTTAFTIGNHTLTAVYNGTPNFLTSNSRPYTLAILLRDFTLTTEPSITIQTEHHKALALTLDSIGDFADTIALSCGKMPEYATCTFSTNGAVLAAGGTSSSTLRIDTDAIYDYLATTAPAAQPPTRPQSRSGIAFALLLPVTLIAAARRRRSLRSALGLFASLSIFFIATAFTGCSGHYPGHTPPGTYTFTITGEGVATHITHTTTVTLIVSE